MRDMQELLNTVAAVYAAPGSHANWNEALAGICQLVGAAEGSYLRVSNQDQLVEAMATSGYSDEHIQRYSGYGGAATDVRFKYLNRLVPGQVFRDFEYVADKAQYDASAWIRYQLETTGTYWCMTALVSSHGLWRDYVSVNRLQSLGPHTEDEKSDLQVLLPHLARAGELERTITRLNDRFGAVLGALDMLQVGLVVLDGEGRVTVANRAARKIADRTGALRLNANGRLSTWQAKRDAQLQALIAVTARSSNGQGQSDGGMVLITKRTGVGLVLVEVMPLSDAGMCDGEDLRGSAVFVLDAEVSLVVSLAGLSSIFELTPTEQEIATSLVNGAAPGEIAEQSNRAFETVRSHLKHVFAKTGAHSQLELLRLAVKLDPPIARE